MKRSRQRESNPALGPTRAERRADARRTRAMSHLERVRGQAPRHTRHTPHALRNAAVALAAVGIGWFVGSTWKQELQTFQRPPRLQSIAVQGARQLDPADIAAAAGIPRGADPAEIRSDVVVANLSAHQWIEAAHTLQLPTGALVVGVVERRPAVRVTGPTGNIVHFADATGTPFAVAEAAETDALPLVRLPRPVEPQIPDATVSRALQLSEALVRSGLPAAVEIGVSADSDPTGYTLRLLGFAPRVILGWEAPEAKLPELARILASEMPEIAGAGELDLRFAGQAVLRNDPLPEGAEQAAEARGFAPPSI